MIFLYYKQTKQLFVMEQLYEKYEKIQLFATKYRGFTLTDEKFYDYDEFKNKIQILEYIMHTFDNPKTGKPVDIYLFRIDSKYILNTINIKKILDKYNDKRHIIMITKKELNVYLKKTIKKYPNLNIKNYLHRHFIMELNRGPLCSKHTILTPDEVRSVCYSTMAHGHKFPAIFESDPQNIWIGGEINDLVKIESYSEITGKTISYRIVTPSSGKVIQNPGTVVETKKSKNLDDDDDADDPVDDADEVNDKNDVDKDHDDDIADNDDDEDIADGEAE